MTEFSGLTGRILCCLKRYGRPAAHRVLSSTLWIPTASGPHSRGKCSFTAKRRLPAPTRATVNELRPAPGSAVTPLKQLAGVSRCPAQRFPFRNSETKLFSGFAYRSVSFGVTCECSTRISSAIDRALPMMQCRYHLNRRKRLTLLSSDSGEDCSTRFSRTRSGEGWFSG